MHGERAYASAREEKRRHCIGVRGHGDGAVYIQKGRIVHDVKDIIGKMTGKQVTDQAL